MEKESKTAGAISEEVEKVQKQNGIPDGEPDTLIIHSVQKALKLLTAICEGENEPVTLAELAQKTGINKSTCAHILSTMAYEGYVDRVSPTKGYRLGAAAYCLSRYGKYDNKFIAVCHPVLRWLFQKTELAVGLATVQNGRVFVIDYINTNPKTLTNGKDIYPEFVYFTPAGRVILANMSERELKEIWEKNGKPKEGHWDEVNSFETLKEQVAMLDGKAVLQFMEPRKDGKLVWGGWSAAIFRYSSCVGAIVISATSENGTMQQALEKEEELKRLLLKARDEISRRLTYEESE